MNFLLKELNISPLYISKITKTPFQTVYRKLNYKTPPDKEFILSIIKKLDIKNNMLLKLEEYISFCKHYEVYKKKIFQIKLKLKKNIITQEEYNLMICQIKAESKKNFQIKFNYLFNGNQNKRKFNEWESRL